MQPTYIIEFNPVFTRAMYVVLGLLVLFNLFLLFVSGSPLELIPILYQGAILIAIYLKKYVARVLIKLWAVLMMAAGGFELLSYLLRYLAYLTGGSTAQLAKIVVSEIPIKLIQFGIGLAVFIYVNRSITKKETEPAQNVA